MTLREVTRTVIGLGENTSGCPVVVNGKKKKNRFCRR